MRSDVRLQRGDPRILGGYLGSSSAIRRSASNVERRSRSGPASISNSEPIGMIQVLRPLYGTLGKAPRWDSPDILTNSWAPFRLFPETKVNMRNLFPLDTRTLSGDPRVGVFVVIDHPYDRNQINNRGEQVHQGGFTSETGRSIRAHIPVFNGSSVSVALAFALLPTDLPTTLAPAARTLAPSEQVILNMDILVPATPRGSPSSYVEKFETVVARHGDGSLFGGATYVVRVND